MANSFADGLTSLISKITNRRNPLGANVFTAKRLMPEQQRAVYRTGIGNKIIRTKAGYALTDTLNFTAKTDADIWHNKLERHAVMATQYMLAYGRGIIVLHQRGDNLSQPLADKLDPNKALINVFSGDMVTTPSPVLDLQSPRYLKPNVYVVRGQSIHHSRVIDFTYVMPPELDMPEYHYGGISEFELIYPQLINDAVIERSSAAIVEKSSTMVYKIAGFNESIMAGREDKLVEYFTQLENYRSIHGALLFDAENDAVNISQAINNLAEVNEMALRRIAMVTGIPVSYLVGEAVRGLNATGANERVVLSDTVYQLQSNYLTSPVWALCDKLGLGERVWADDQGVTDAERAEHEGKIIDNGVKLATIGEDAQEYLVERGLAKKQDFDSFWSDGGEAEEVEPITEPEQAPDALTQALTDSLERINAETAAEK